MVKYTIKNIVVLPLFIATLLTSFYVMQPQNAFAAHTEIYKDSGDDSGTPLASDRFDAIEDGDVDTIANQDSSARGATNSKVTLELQQFIDCERGVAPQGTCQSIFMSGDQDVHFIGDSGFVDVEADLFMLQKDDTDGQNNVDNTIRGKQNVLAQASGSSTIDISHNSNNNELNFDMYQYNKRGPISESTSDFEIDDVQAAVASESNGGNDDTTNINYGEQELTAISSTRSVIQAATTGDLDFRLAQFNAGCDDFDNGERDITCENQAIHDINLETTMDSRLNFNTPSPIEHQQINTCTFSDILRCLNNGNIDVRVLVQGSAQANVELENPNGQPVLFQENTCSDLANSPTQQQCTNLSNNFFDVDSGIDPGDPTDNSNIQKTNLDLQVAQANDCDNASAPIDCVNRGLVSGIDDLNGRNIQTEFGPANTIVTVSATGDSTVEDADPNSFLTMVNDCDGANPEVSTLGSSNCVNEALNEAHFAASTGGYVDVDSVTQQSTTENFCDNLDDDTCKNTAQNTFVANAAGDGTININSDVVQTNFLENACNSAECTNNAINAMLLTADDGATITASGSDLRQTTNLYNGCTSEADCDNVALNQFTVTADPTTTGGNVIISDLTQQISLSNTCSGSTTECSLEGQNFYTLTNTDDSPITISPYQSISLSCSGSTDCNKDQTNTLTYTKTGGTSLSFSSSQTATSGGADNSYVNTAGTFSGCRTLTQTNGGGQTTPSPC